MKNPKTILIGVDVAAGTDTTGIALYLNKEKPRLVGIICTGVMPGVGIRHSLELLANKLTLHYEAGHCIPEDKVAFEVDHIEAILKGFNELPVPPHPREKELMESIELTMLKEVEPYIPEPIYKKRKREFRNPVPGTRKKKRK